MKVWARAITFVMLVAVSNGASRAAGMRLVCLAPAETRELLQSHQYIRPFRALAEASRSGQGDPIGIRMCRFNDTVVYDVMLLRHDGRVVGALVPANRADHQASSAPLAIVPADEAHAGREGTAPPLAAVPKPQ